MSKKDGNLKQESLNKILQAERMTPERLKAFPGLENLEEDQALDLIKKMENYCDIIVRHVSKKKMS